MSFRMLQSENRIYKIQKNHFASLEMALIFYKP